MPPCVSLTQSNNVEAIQRYVLYENKQMTAYATVSACLDLGKHDCMNDLFLFSSFTQ